MRQRKGASLAKLLQMPSLFDEDSLPELWERNSSPPQPSRSAVADAAQRQAALDIQTSCIVEAPAGSGKTGLLIQRYLKLLAFGGVEQPSEVLAITFTRKADAEMRRRILMQLAAAAENDALAEDASDFDRETRQVAEAVLRRDRDLGWHLLASPQQLNIRTIDSFCAELAGSLPLLSGVIAGLTPTEDGAPLYQAAAERTLLHLGGPDRALSDDLDWLLLHRDADLGDFTSLLAEMLRQREQWGELLPLGAAQLTDATLDAEVLPQLQRTLEHLIEDELARCSALIGPELLASAASLACQWSLHPSSGEAPSPLGAFATGSSSLRPKAADLERWVALRSLLLTGTGRWRSRFSPRDLGFELPKSEQEQLRSLIAAFRSRASLFPGLDEVLCDLGNLPEARYPEDQWRAVKSLCRVLRQALIELQLVFAERRSCDFTEVALVARSLLRSEAAAADLLATSVARLRHLLVDEMQDTSAGQYELIEALTSSWDGATQTIFLVGDPKQSIYEFRQARVERFLRIMRSGQFGQVRLQSLRLTANFRSQAHLVEDFNTVFEQILPSPEALAQQQGSSDVPFVAASPTRAATTSPALHWQLAHEASHGNQSRIGQDPTGGQEPPAVEADQAQRLREVLEHFQQAWPRRSEAGSGTRPARIAVLARNRAHLAPILREFRSDRGRGPLPYRAVEIESLAERPEILDLLMLTRALLHPADRAAWLAVLRSPLCGLSLSDLLMLVGEGQGDTRHATVLQLVEQRASLLSALGQELLARSWPVLHAAVAGLGRTAFSLQVERTWDTLGGDAPLRSHERANTRRFLHLLHELETGAEPLSLALLRRRLVTLYAEPAVDADCTVELMTIHKAKGLEWDLVLVPAMERGSGRGDPDFLQWLEFDHEGHSADFLVAPIQGKGESATRLRQWMGKRQRQREAAEARRLVYVACTRAQEELHLFGTIGRNRDGTPCLPPAGSLLRAAWPAVCTALEIEPAPAAPEANVITMEAPSPSSPSGLALAAAGEPEVDAGPPAPAPATASASRHLPLAFNFKARLQRDPASSLPYPAAASLRHETGFARPDGSFAARAFGNAVHRFLDLLAQRLAAGQTPASLLEETGSWTPRLVATLRSEGLSPTQARADADRARSALAGALRDPGGVWLLSAHTAARNEVAVIAAPGSNAGGRLRADRTFFAPATPGSTIEESCLWIVDYKTAALGGRNRHLFLKEQKAKYLPQMQAYARAAAEAGQPPERIVLALYFPLLPALVQWFAGKRLP